MSGSALIGTLFGALVSDAASAKALAVSNVLGATVAEAIQAISRRRIEAAREILLEELRLGEKVLEDAAQLEEVVTCFLRYGRAAQEGAARLNLRLMASVLSGLYTKSRLVSDEFLYFSDLLASLRREEVVIAATFERITRTTSDRHPDGRAKGIEVQKQVVAELVPNYMVSESELRAYCASLLRTGLLEFVSPFGGAFYRPTPILERLCSYANLEAALLKQGEEKN